MYNPQLETFLQVADAGSFNKAAQERFIVPSAVIKQINQLEKSLGVELFIRTYRGLALTEAGKSLYQDARYVIDYCNESVKRARNAIYQGESVIRIGTSAMTPGQFLVDLWPNIQAHCPGVKIQLIPFENTPQNAREILRNLGQHIDLVAGAFDQAFLDSRGCAGMTLCYTPIRCAVSINHHLADKEELTMEDLSGENFFLIHRGWNSSLDQLRDDLLAYYSSINIMDFDFLSLDVFNQCENSGGILMMLDYWKDVHPLLKIIPVRWDYTIAYGLLYAPEPTPTVQRFLTAVQNYTTDANRI